MPRPLPFPPEAPGWRSVELTLPRSGQTLPRPGCFKDPYHPLPKREGPLSFALDLPIFRGEPVAEAAGLQPTPRRVAPQTAPPGPGTFGPGAGGQPGAMVWGVRTNYAVRRGMGQKMGLINGQLGTTPVIPWGVGGGEVGGGGGLD
jgi:hypothetical protein